MSGNPLGGRTAVARTAQGVSDDRSGSGDRNRGDVGDWSVQPGEYDVAFWVPNKVDHGTHSSTGICGQVTTADGDRGVLGRCTEVSAVRETVTGGHNPRCGDKGTGASLFPADSKVRQEWKFFRCGR
ncbi:hypothetical protein Sar04_12690 [Salinispora arenicola]|uniref:Uncharacterized protein n=1 Tax=Salinispora arenicola TaxID=168697 RepID=A0ABQ4JNU9_SALAC|nr:hypothetical protein Sar04_12690 [Salinispora arenicola]